MGHIFHGTSTINKILGAGKIQTFAKLLSRISFQIFIIREDFFSREFLPVKFLILERQKNTVARPLSVNENDATEAKNNSKTFRPENT